MNTKTELNQNFEYRNDPAFHKAFFRDFFICVAIGFSASIGLIFAVLNADRIDAFFAEVIKAIFL